MTRKRAITDQSTGTDRALRALGERLLIQSEQARAAGDGEACDKLLARRVHVSQIIGTRQRQKNLTEAAARRAVLDADVRRWRFYET